MVRDPQFQSHYTYKNFEGWKMLSEESFRASFDQLYSLKCLDFPIFGAFCGRDLSHFFVTIDLPPGKCDSKMKLNFDISVFDNWNQEIFVLSVDNVPEDLELPEKVNFFHSQYCPITFYKVSAFFLVWNGF